MCAALAATGGVAHGQILPDLRGDVEENVLQLPGARQTPSLTTVRAPGEPEEAREPIDLLPGERPQNADPFDDAAVFGPVDSDDDIETARNAPGEDDVADVITGAIEDETALNEPAGRVQAIEPVGPLQTGVGSIDPDPYAPVGLRLGTFDINTTLDLGLSYTRSDDTFEVDTSPPTFESQQTDGIFSDAALRVDAVSDWSRHQLRLGFGGRLPARLSGDEQGQPSADVDAALRLDLDRETTLTVSARYGYAQDDPGSAAVFEATDATLFPDIQATNDPTLQSFGGGATLERQAGPFSALAAINVDREIYGDAKLSDGRAIAQDDLDFTRYSGRLRGGYAISPVLTPFVEVEYSQRVMDERPDTGGFDRNSTRYALRLGTRFDRGEKFNGEVAVGYVWEDLADAQLADIEGVSVNANLNWSPVRETDVRVGFATTTTASGTEDVSGSLLYAASVGVTHRARANLELTADAGLDYENVIGLGEDTITASAEVGATLWFNRFMGLTGRLGYDRTFSDDPDEESQTRSAFIGLRLQR